MNSLRTIQTIQFQMVVSLYYFIFNRLNNEYCAIVGGFQLCRSID